jgi:hypothetical protein
MQINLGSTSSPELVKDIPAKLLASLVEGEKVQATVLAKLSAEAVRIQVANTLLQLNTKQPLAVGQQVLLEKVLVAGKPFLRIDNVLPVDNAPRQLTLQPGQQIAVEVLKILADNKLLASPRLTLSTPTVQTTPSQPNLPTTIPRQIEIDISALKRSFNVGDKVSLEVKQVAPLVVRVQAEPLTRAEQIQQYQRTTLSQINQNDAPTIKLSHLTQPERASVLPRTVTELAAKVIANLNTRTEISQAEPLKQALTRSGHYLENQIRQHVQNPQTKSLDVSKDFKANLLQLAEALKSVLKSAPNTQSSNLEWKQTLPVEVRAALQKVIDTPELLRPLATQIQPNVEKTGQTPVQLLMTLLAGLKSLPGQSGVSLATNTAAPLAGESPLLTNSAVTDVQRFLNTQAPQSKSSEMVLRAIEFQFMRDLLREVESATTRIQMNQLSMVKDPDTPNNNQVWLFDMPIRDKQQLDSLQMRIEQHQSKHTEDESVIWQVQLNLETQNLGPMQALISLYKQDVKVVILAEREQTTHLLNQHMESLNQRLSKIGLNVSHLSSRQAPISPIQAEMPARVSEYLLDVSV